LKYNNFNHGIFLARKSNLFQQKIFEIEKIAFKNESYELFFQQDAKTIQKTRLSTTFSLLVQIE